MYKIKLPRDFFETCKQMTKVTRCSCWHQNFVPKGLSAPASGLYTIWKNVYKIMYLVVSLVVLRAGCGIWLYQFLIIAYLFTFQINVFETCSKWLKWQEVSVDIKILSPGDCQPLSCGYIHLLNHEKMSMKSEVEQMTKVMRPSCWHQNVGPNVLSAPAQGLYTCRKSWKSVHKIRGHS